MGVSAPSLHRVSDMNPLVKFSVLLLVDVVTILFLSLPGLTVGLEETSYTVTEGDDIEVEVCAVVYTSSTECIADFPFNISLSTSSSSGMYTCAQYFGLLMTLYIQTLPSS